jgi:hypothetical protein
MSTIAQIKTIQTSRQSLIAAKNYLEQKIEAATGRKARIIFGPYRGRNAFMHGTALAGLEENGILKIFDDVASGIPASVRPVRLDQIESADALYCKRCRIYYEMQPGVTRCTCHTYLKPRKAFYVHGENKIRDSTEICDLAGVQSAIRQYRERKVQRKYVRPLAVQTPGLTACGMAAREEMPAPNTTLAHAIVSLKIGGRKVPQDCIEAAIIGLGYQPEEDITAIVPAN